MLQFRPPHVRVAPFESPCAALARFKTTEFNAVVTDVKMTELDGLALLRQAHAIRPRVPVIMMSGHAERAIVIDAMSIGAFDVLRKPFDRDEFVTAVTYALAAHKLSRGDSPTAPFASHDAENRRPPCAHSGESGKTHHDSLHQTAHTDVPTAQSI
jgi:DNA-binding NtrC family response regulator